MSDTQVPYLYCLLRLVPDLDRGEALNVGLVIFCRPQRVLQVSWQLASARLDMLAPNLPYDLIATQLTTLELIAAGDDLGGPVSALDLGERFHWLSNVSNTMIQPGPVHSGLTEDAAATFTRLFTRLVAPPAPHS